MVVKYLVVRSLIFSQIFMMEQPISICFTPVGRMVWEELTSQTEQVAIHMQILQMFPQPSSTAKSFRIYNQWPPLAILPICLSLLQATSLSFKRTLKLILSCSLVCG